MDSLLPVALESGLWRFTLNIIRTAADLHDYIATALEEQAAGSSLPFAIIEQSSGRAIGSTRFGNIVLAQHRLEIGRTWYGTAWQRTGCNTECKLLLLTHAFEVLKCRRVELKTNALNMKSRTAILRLGAKQEGTLRQHAISWDGTNRDTVYYSIIDDEWPSVKQGLVRRLES